MLFLKQSILVTIKMGPFVDATDGVTEETALSPVVEVSKNGAAFAARNSVTAITHDADGWYAVELNTTDTGTLGRLQVKSQDPANHVPVWHDFFVLDPVMYQAMVANSTGLASDSLSTNLQNINGSANAADRLRSVVENAIDLTVTNAFNSPTTTSFDIDASAFSFPNYPNVVKQAIRFNNPLSVDLKGISRFIATAVNNAGNQTIEVTLDEALSVAPTNNDDLVLYGTSV